MAHSRLSQLWGALDQFPEAFDVKSDPGERSWEPAGSLIRMRDGAASDIPGVWPHMAGREFPATILGETGPSGRMPSPQPVVVEAPAGWDEAGTETLAWYQSRHFYRHKYGIYIRAYGVEVVSDALVSAGFDRLTAPAAAYDFLVGHELGHFHTEVLVTTMELTQRVQLFARSREAQYQLTPTWNTAEEGLCNDLARRTLPKGWLKALDGWLDVAPIGYRDYARHRITLRSSSWGEVLGGLLSRSVPGEVPWVAWSDVRQLYGSVPISLIPDGMGLDGAPRDTLLGPIVVRELDSFGKDLKKSGNPKGLAKKWQARKTMMAAGNLTGGHLERVAGTPNGYSAAVSDGYRAGLARTKAGEWLAIFIDQQHDELYRRMQRAQLPE